MKNRFKETFKSDSSYRALFASIVTFALSFGLYKGIIDNYLAEVAGMSEFDKGVSEFFRELPGLGIILVLAVFYTASAAKLYQIGAVIMLAGLAMQAMIPSTKVLVIMAIFIYSLGEHMQLGMRNTLTLEYAKEGKSGAALGRQNAVYQIGTLAGYLVVIGIFFVLGNKTSLFKPIFWMSAAIILIGMLIAFRIKGESLPDKSKSRFYFHKKYTKYYMLELFYGARKQVFFTFGPYTLVLFYGASARAISILFAITSVCSYLASPIVGRIIDRIGYKVVMISDTLILVIVCFFYGFAHHIFPMHIAFIICCANYVLDAVISLASMAANVYVQDLADNGEEVKATISTGLSVNHLVTILVALFGGWIWKTLGIETLFILSAVLGLCNSAYAATIKTRKAGEAL
ncbi:MAG: MFS transporter [Lachnospiraceae bacterium]|nr:MFS transporter [Lachnospiraceae bacterium]